MDFKVGDLVVLRSGGPTMTVTFIHGKTSNGGTHYCQWFKGHEVQGSDFPSEGLAPAPGTVKDSCLKSHSDACLCGSCLEACRNRLESSQRWSKAVESATEFIVKGEKDGEEHRDDH